jgi:hypothetical protein
MIGSDGGTFAFGDTTFARSVRWPGIHINDVVSTISS